MDGKLEGTLSHYLGLKIRKRHLIKKKKKRAPKCSPSCHDLIFQNTFWCYVHNFCLRCPNEFFFNDLER
jgi:hypothetical protein